MLSAHVPGSMLPGPAATARYGDVLSGLAGKTPLPFWGDAIDVQETHGFRRVGADGALNLVRHKSEDSHVSMNGPGRGALGHGGNSPLLPALYPPLPPYLTTQASSQPTYLPPHPYPFYPYTNPPPPLLPRTYPILNHYPPRITEMGGPGGGHLPRPPFSSGSLQPDFNTHSKPPPHPPLPTSSHSQLVLQPEPQRRTVEPHQPWRPTVSSPHPTRAVCKHLSGKEGSLKHRILDRREGTPNYQYFQCGSLIQLGDGERKRVEELRTEDFVKSAEVSSDLELRHSTITRIEERRAAGTTIVTLSVGPQNSQVSIEVGVEYPFFVCGQGWSSMSPDLSMASFNLPCQQLRVGDVCIALTPRQAVEEEGQDGRGRRRKRRWSTPSEEEIKVAKT